MEKLSVQELIQSCRECIDTNVLKSCSQCETYQKLSKLDVSRFYSTSLKEKQDKALGESEEL